MTREIQNSASRVGIFQSGKIWS